MHLKKVTSILFLLLYINAAFANTDCYCCRGMLVNVKLQVPAKAECKDGMGCSNKETISCKTDNHNSKVLTTAQGLSLNEYTSNNAVTMRVDLFSSIVVKQFNGYYLTRTAPPREILSLIHVLRIWFPSPVFVLIEIRGFSTTFNFINMFFRIELGPNNYRFQ